MDNAINSKVLNQENTLSFSEKVAYGLGELASQFSWGLVGSYLLFFYTDVIGYKEAVIGILIAVARVWSIIVDLIVGIYIQNKSTKLGRFRPYILFGSIFLMIFNIMTFTIPNIPENIKIIYSFVSYLFLVTFYSIVNLPYGVLAYSMTRDTEDRTSLGISRSFFSMIGGTALGGLIMPLVNHFGKGNNILGFQFTSVIFSLLSFPLFILVFIKCKERIIVPQRGKAKIRDSFKIALINKSYIMFLISLFIMFTALFSRMGTVIYYYMNNLKVPQLISKYMLILGVSGAVGTLILKTFSKKFEKSTIVITSSLIAGLMLLTNYFLKEPNFQVMTIILIVYGLTMGIGSSLAFSIIGDCIEYVEWKTSIRADGLIYSIFSMTTKVSVMIAGVFNVWILGFIGYKSNSIQSIQTLNGLNIVSNLVPAILYFISVIPLFFYTLTKKELGKIAEEINSTEDTIIKQKIESIKNDLIKDMR